MNPDLKQLSDLDRLIHEPARLVLVALLSGIQEADFLYLQRESGLTKGNLSSHLMKLEEGRYVEIEKTFRGKLPLTLIRLTKEGRKAYVDYRKRLGNFLVNGI